MPPHISQIPHKGRWLRRSQPSRWVLLVMMALLGLLLLWGCEERGQNKLPLDRFRIRMNGQLLAARDMRYKTEITDQGRRTTVNFLLDNGSELNLELLNNTPGAYTLKDSVLNIIYGTSQENKRFAAQGSVKVTEFNIPDGPVSGTMQFTLPSQFGRREIVATDGEFNQVTP